MDATASPRGSRRRPRSRTVRKRVALGLVLTAAVILVGIVLAQLSHAETPPGDVLRALLEAEQALDPAAAATGSETGAIRTRTAESVIAAFQAAAVLALVAGAIVQTRHAVQRGPHAPRRGRGASAQL